MLPFPLLMPYLGPLHMLVVSLPGPLAAAYPFSGLSVPSVSLPVPDQQQAVVCQHLYARHSHSGPQVQPDKSIWEAAAPLAAGLAVAFWTGAQS